MVKFTVIISVHSYDVKECLDSVINQTLDSIEIICIENARTDNSPTILKSYENKDNRIRIHVCSQEICLAKARKCCIEHAKGEYICLLDNNEILSENALSSAYKVFNDHEDIDIISLNMLNYNDIKESALTNNKCYEIYRLDENPEKIELSLHSPLIRCNSMNNLRFSTEHIDDKFTLINKILLENKNIALINDAYYIRKSEEENVIFNSICESKENLDTINEKLISLNDIINHSLEKEGKIPEFIKYSIVYGLKTFEAINEFPEDSSKENIENTYNQIYNVLSHTDKKIISNPSIIKNVNFRRFLIYLKNNRKFTIETDDKKSRITLKTDDYTINKLQNHKIYFDIVEIKNGFLNFSGNFTSSCNIDALTVEAVKTLKDGRTETYKGKYIEYPTTNRKTLKYLGIPWKFSYNFDLSIPIKNHENSKIEFYVVYNENDKKIMMKNGIKFRYHSNLSEMSNYFIKDSQVVLFRGKTFYIQDYTYSKVLKFEFKTLIRIFKSKKDQFIKSILYRFLYIIVLPFMKNKEIWLFQDRPTIADADGSYLFKYAIKQNTDISMYFVIDKKSDDYKKMLKINKNIVDFGSLKHKVLYLFAKKIICPWTNRDYVNPFYYDNFELYRGFLTPVYFIQHGIIMGDLSRRYNKARDNVALFSTSSDYERDSIVYGHYNQSKDTVQVVGLPRYDSLESKDVKKQILFVPTWRRNMRKEEDLLNSNYYKRLDGFLNNEKLIGYLKEKDYKIIFKPHPELLKYSHLFSVNNENVTIEIKESYQKLFNESSIMVTDYSSVFFDFAYLKKPLIYYQYKGVHEEYTYEKGYFDFETMGFGDIIETEDKLVNRIIEYVENDCIMDEKYKERVDEFFKFNDKNNCKRVFKWIMSH